MTPHRMRAQRVPELGKVVFTCPQCDRVVEIDAEGALRVVVRGDAAVPHAGGTFGRFDDPSASLDAAVQPNPPEGGAPLH